MSTFSLNLCFLKGLSTSRSLFDNKNVGSPFFVKFSFQNQFIGGFPKQRCSQNSKKAIYTGVSFSIKFKVVGWKKNPTVQVHSFKFWESFKNYLVAHVRTAVPDILGYHYIGISYTKSTLKKCTLFSSILVFIHFKLILESWRTSGVYLEPYQKSVMQKRFVIDIWHGSKCDSAASFFRYFPSFFVWILEWIYEHFVFF